ncbi:hypothetical protein DSC45_34585 [Streptomyces sp. YIM 130001]|nr:hypothetical protein DSC45_34585 [Streptomyces sp. YIM 130001]
MAARLMRQAQQQGPSAYGIHADKLSSGGAFGIFADTRVATNGPRWTEKGGRASIPATQNQGAFHKFQPAVWRLVDNDAFYVSNPGFEHCDAATAATCE